MKKTTKDNSAKALVLFSGGQDSTTCLAWTKSKFQNVQAITFDYDQRHKIEIKSAKKICKFLKVPLYIHKIDLKNLTKNALTNQKIKITKAKNSLPSTFVPGRNLIFLTFAAIHAYNLGIENLVTGVCQTDFSGYPDCRDEFIKSAEKTINLAMLKSFKVHTPLMWLTKAETIKLLQELNQVDLLKHTHTCYKGKALACGKCPACKLRLKGFKEANIKDPIKYE